MGQLRALLAASFLLCVLTVVATAQEQNLQLGTPVERQLGPGQAHTYTVTLEENQFVQLVIEQRGIDVIVRVASPAGKSLGDYDSPNGNNGPENVSFVAATPGAYRVTVAPLSQESAIPTGQYLIKIIELRKATDEEIKNYKNLEVVKAKGIALLDEVDGLIPELHSPQTRIRVQMQAAQLLWEVDEKRATKYLTDAVNGVKEFLSAVDPQSQEYVRSYSAVTQLRYELIQALAAHDPDAALNFLYSSKVPAAPYGNQREQASQDHELELSIANQILAKDPKRTLQIARQTLKKGYSSNLLNTVSAMRQKNPEMAAELAGDIANKLLGEKLLQKPEAAALSIGMLSVCNMKYRLTQRPNSRAVPAEQVLPEQVCRDLLQKVAQEALAYTAPALNTYSGERDAAWGLLTGLQTVGQDLDTVVPGGAASVQKRLAELAGGGNPYQVTVQNFQTKMEAGAMDGALESIQKAPQEMKEQLYMQAANMMAANGEGARARQIINDNISNPYQRRQAIASLDQQELYHAMSQGRIEEALRTIAALKTPRERANLLMQITRQIGPGQKRASALSLLEQARSLLAPANQAAGQEEMGALLELARAFSRYDSKRAFDIVDPLVDQFNDICAAARTLDGFGLETYLDDELDLQNGNGVANVAMQVTGTLGTLALTNFERAKLTSDRLRLPEVRLRAYLDIAQQTIQGAR